MFGFLVGTLCLVGLVKVLRWGRWGGRGWHGHHGGWGGGYGSYAGGCGSGPSCGPGSYDADCGPGGGPGFDRGGPPPWGFRGPFRGGVADRVSYWLGANEEQSRTIQDALHDFWKEVRDVRGEASESRKDVAKAVRAASFDAKQMDKTFARQDRHIETVRKAFIGAVGRIHTVLTEEQRERLARLVERGPWGGGPYRAPAWM